MSYKKEILYKYKNIMSRLYRFMVSFGYTSNIRPKIILDNTNQGEDNIYIYTGYFDPNNNAIRIFIYNRSMPDILKTLSHELIHYKQHVDGVINKSGYSSTNIIEDDKLVPLEAEAYIKGNKAFEEFKKYETKRKYKKKY